MRRVSACKRWRRFGAECFRGCGATSSCCGGAKASFCPGLTRRPGVDWGSPAATPPLWVGQDSLIGAVWGGGREGKDEGGEGRRATR